MCCTPRTGPECNHHGTNFQTIPSLDLGIVTLTNAGPVGAAEAVNTPVLDLVQFGQINSDWISDYRAAVGHYYNPVGDLVDETPPAGQTAPSNLDGFTGSYANDYFGPLIISNEDGALVAALGPGGGYRLKLTPWDTDTFLSEPTGENAPAGSLASASFERTAGQVTGATLGFFNDKGLGCWEKAAQ